MDNDICQMSAIELQLAIQTKRLSPVEVISAVLDRAQSLQPILNCFITLCGERAMEEARAAEKAVMAGQPLGKLHGIPFSVKDLVNTAGVATTFGALPMQHNVPDHDAVSVRRLREQGAILIGKTTTPEFGSKGFTDSPLFGTTRNAWDAGKTCGGSSGGAAVAIAAGLGPLAVATDGGGSTRIPAACNGVVGIKQSIGVIPHDQAADLIGNQTYVTPMTRNVQDTALMMQVMAGADAHDPWSIGRSNEFTIPSANPDSLSGCRIKFRLSPNDEPVATDVENVFQSVLAQLTQHGAHVSEMPTLGLDIEPIWRTINHTTWNGRYSKLVQERRNELSPTFQRQIESVVQFSAIDYQAAMFARTALFHRIQALLNDADFLVMPTLTRTALDLGTDIFDTIEINGQHYDNIRARWYPWTMPFNMTGHPAISIPCGWGTDGLPIGLQIVGHYQRDAELLTMATAIETVLNLRQQPSFDL
ncbi:amidase [Alcaligenaceae bacterium]|nr:amidase [Alcaligenaceae bacterium]